jgi:hypothetical protein
MPEENPAKFLFLKPNTLSDVMIAQISLKKLISRNLASIRNFYKTSRSYRYDRHNKRWLVKGEHLKYPLTCELILPLDFA